MSINEEIIQLQGMFLGFSFNQKDGQAMAENIIAKLEKLRLSPANYSVCGSEIGKKNDSGKTEYHLMPAKALEQVNVVLMYGAKKYGENNWQKVEGWRNRYYNASMRHLLQWQSGEKLDPESGITHLAHAICSLMFLIERELDQS
jgi:hypothetical protein